MTTISLCMIVKDEAENIRLCLDSVKGVVDEIIIVDTGSKDNTVEICREYTDKIYHFDWIDDFSAARNESIKYATKDWILVLDADEVLAKGSARQMKKYLSVLRKDYDVFVVRIYEMPKEEICSDLQKSTRTFNYVPRLFRNNRQIAYKYSLHEVPMRDVYLAAHTSIKIFHYGYSQPSKERAKRAIACLQKDLQKYPQDKFVRFNLARSYSLIGEYEQMIKIMDELISEINRTKETIPQIPLYGVYKFYVQILLNEKLYQKAVEVCFAWLSRLKEKRDLRPYIYLVKAYLFLGKNAEAKKLMDAIQQVYPNSIKVIPIMDRVWVRADIDLILAYLKTLNV